jgi:hypothetical protein
LEAVLQAVNIALRARLVTAVVVLEVGLLEVIHPIPAQERLCCISHESSPSIT